MTQAHVHLMLNHVPVLAALAGAVTLTVGLRRSHGPTVRVALWILVGAALVAVPVYLTGEGAEEIAERLPGAGEGVIEPHEEFALYALTALLAAGALSLGGLALTASGVDPIDGGPASWFLRGTWLAAAAAAVLTAWTAYLGGKINHPEIRPGFTPPAEQEVEEGAAALPGGESGRTHDERLR